jgi:putative ABC transport system ATP-binding protein
MMMQAVQASSIEAGSRPKLAVQCRSLVKEFGTAQTRVRVLRGIDVDIELGKQTFLVGPSGCGKTTLVSVMAGLLTATEGSVHVLGTEIAKLRSSSLVDFRAKNLGFVFQQFNLIPALNALENAAVPLVVQGQSMHRAIKDVERLFEKLDMGPHRLKYPNQLSGGQQQRVAVARALIHQPRLIICDEPTASLDAEAGHAVMELLSELAAAPDRAVLVVTHDSRIFSFADTIIHLSDGQVLRVEEQTATKVQHEN